MYWQLVLPEETATTRISPHCENEHLRSVNGLWLCKYSNQTVLWSLLDIIDASAALIARRERNTVIAPF